MSTHKIYIIMLYQLFNKMLSGPHNTRVMYLDNCSRLTTLKMLQSLKHHTGIVNETLEAALCGGNSLTYITSYEHYIFH